MLARTIAFVALVLALAIPATVAAQDDDENGGYMEGFPLEYRGARLPKVADMDGDGLPEILVSSAANGLGVFDHQGNMLEGWPYFPGSFWRYLVGDVDGDGEPEVLVGAGSHEIWVVSARGERQLKIRDVGQDFIGQRINDVGTADLDNDGVLDIVALARKGGDHRVYAWHGDGEALPGFPALIEEDYAPEELSIGEFALGDLDFDGTTEIVLGAAAFDDDDYLSTAPLFVLDHDGSMREGFPVIPEGVEDEEYGQSLLDPIIADLDGDFSCEIIGSSGWQSFVVHADGTTAIPPDAAPGFHSRPAAVADLDNDGDLEVIFAKRDLRIYDLEDGLIAETTAPEEFRGLSVGDVDGDGNLEIAVWSFEVSGGFWDRTLHVYNKDLEHLPGWPKNEFSAGWQFWRATTVMADLDGDGDVELIWCHKGHGEQFGVIYVWDFENTGGGPVSIAWPFRRHDTGHSGYAHFGTSATPPYLRGDVDGDGRLGLADFFDLVSVLAEGRGDHPCPARVDFEGDERIGIADLIGLLEHLFLGGAAPPAPYPMCGRRRPANPLRCIEWSCPPWMIIDDPRARELAPPSAPLEAFHDE